MKSFLEYVAEDIIQKYGTNLSRIAIVFPNKRASLFLNEALARQAQRPIWSPAYITISELFRQQSDLRVADPIQSVCLLHQSFCAITGSTETLDKFYGWGQLLLSDFDDIDKNMADADRVLANLRDIHELDDLSYLTDEQREMLQRFFSNFTEEHPSELKERFLHLWNRMADIYHDFRQRMASQGLAYEGMLYRQVVEDLTVGCGSVAADNTQHPSPSFSLASICCRRSSSASSPCYGRKGRPVSTGISTTTMLTPKQASTSAVIWRISPTNSIWIALTSTTISVSLSTSALYRLPRRISKRAMSARGYSRTTA